LSRVLVSYIMSKKMHVKTLEPKKRELPPDKPLATNHGTVMSTIIVVVALSLVIGLGFAYIGYVSGHYSAAYGLCREDILSHERMGAYQSVNEITVALESCNGVTS
jgi:uncharacterized membrane protein YkgB